MKLAFVIPDMGVGGAQRVVALMANYWAEKGHEISIVSFDDGSVPSVFSLHKGVRQIYLSLRKDSGNAIVGMIRNIGRIRRLRTTLRGFTPDVVLSGLDTTNIRTILATRGIGVTTIATEHTEPSGRDIGKSWELLRRMTYPWADAVVCLGERPLSYFGARIRRRGFVIPNPVTIPAQVFGTRADLALTKKIYTIISIGSLRPVKGYDLLLEAFARVAACNQDWRLVIWGEGKLRADLEAQAKKLGVSDRFTLPGVTREPYSKLVEADLFVLPSRVEGWGMALCEAMSVGLPVIATDVGAVSDVVRDGIDGILVPPNNVDALITAVDRLMRSREERLRLAARGPEVLERFSIEKVMDRWEALISRLLGKDSW